MKKENRIFSQLEKEIKQSFATKKRIFIALLSITSAAVVIFLLSFWLIPVIGLSRIHPAAPIILGLIVIFIISMVLWCTISLILSILLKREVLFSEKTRGMVIKLFLPLMTLVGSIFGIPKEKVRASFINVNNEMILTQGKKYPPEKILLLLPHCLQRSTCTIRLTYHIENCKRCGKCPIGHLLEIRDNYGIKMAIATGGTIARRIVVENKPLMIIAVACERDLASGIQDTYPLPVFGVLNIRPHGPCIDTLVSLDQICWALEKFVERPDEKTS